MSCTELVILTSRSREAAKDALRELKRLDHEGWIDVTCYSLVEGASAGLQIVEASACAVNLAAAIDFPLAPGDFALLVTVEQRYAERVAAEFEARGITRRWNMQEAQCESALRASMEEIRAKIAWLVELLDNETGKAARSFGADKERIESGIRAGRTELAAARANLQARLVALRTELEARLPESGRKAKKSGAARSPEEVEREIADLNEELALSLLDHLDALAAHAVELREQASQARTGIAAAILEQLEELDLHARKYRADLTATLAASASLARRSLERVRAAAKLRKAALDAGLEYHVKQLEQRHALLKADIQQLQRKDASDWIHLPGGFRQTWRQLRESTDITSRECR